MADDEWKGRVDARLNALERDLAISGVHKDNIDSRLSGIEDTLKWLVRLILGALIAAALGFAISGGFYVGG